MNLDNKFTEKLKEWLEQPEAERDYSVGALYLLKLSGNQIMYKNIIRCLDSRKQFVEYRLQKYYNFRVQVENPSADDPCDQVCLTPCAINPITPCAKIKLAPDAEMPQGFPCLRGYGYAKGY